MTNEDFKAFACFVVAVSAGTGGLKDNPTPVTSVLFLVLCAGSVVVLLVNRLKTYSEMVNKLAFIWSVSDIFFFSNPDSITLAMFFITAFVTVPSIFIHFRRK